jgi:hypothetical protein
LSAGAEIITRRLEKTLWFFRRGLARSNGQH